jgi:glutamate dehydrogenase/leucine dehydrogenase
VFDELLRAWDGEEVVVRYDAPSGTWMFVCIHSTALGPAAGGTRMKTYAHPWDALADGLRLSTSMTRKNAVAGLPLGGGKAVLSVPEIPNDEARRSLLLRYANVVESLHGTYWTACDMNTSPADMDVLGERCSSVFGKTGGRGGSGTSAPATADGVFVGIRASTKHAFGTDDLSGRTVLVQGVGAVGSILARLVAEAGARVVVTDVDEIRAKELAVEVDGDVVAPEDAIGSECDVFSPNATGGVLSAESIPSLRCRIVAGAANNQLAEPADAERFAQRDILYAPDYVVNAGGIIHLASLEMLGETVEERDARIAAIGETVTEVFRIADAEHISTERAADRILQQRLAESAR